MKNRLETKYDARFCPQCGDKTHVYSCDGYGKDFIRYRRCKKCHFTFRTIEVPVKYKVDSCHDEEVLK